MRGIFQFGAHYEGEAYRRFISHPGKSTSLTPNDSQPKDAQAKERSLAPWIAVACLAFIVARTKRRLATSSPGAPSADTPPTAPAAEDEKGSFRTKKRDWYLGIFLLIVMCMFTGRILTGTALSMLGAGMVFVSACFGAAAQFGRDVSKESKRWETSYSLLLNGGLFLLTAEVAPVILEILDSEPQDRIDIFVNRERN